MRSFITFFIATFAIGLLVTCQEVPTDEHASIGFMIGDVSLNNIDASVGMAVNQKDVIKTGKNSFCDIKIGKSLIRVKENSKLTFSELTKNNGIEQTVLGLKVGKMLCKPKKLMRSEKFMIKTATAVAGVRGTKFTVQADAKSNTLIKVFGGKVKIARRVKQLENNIDKVLEHADPVGKQEKVIITKKEVIQAEKVVARILKRQAIKKVNEKMALTAVIKQAKKNIVVVKQNVQKFTGKDYVKDNKELIAVKKKPKKIIMLLVRTIKRERIKPKPDGTLLITHFDVYFIKKGKIKWEGKVTEKAVKQNNKIYIASGNYIFCAKEDGEVQWRKQIENDNKLAIKEGKLLINSKGKEVFLDLETGQKM